MEKRLWEDSMVEQWLAGRGQEELEQKHWGKTAENNCRQNNPTRGYWETKMFT